MTEWVVGRYSRMTEWVVGRYRHDYQNGFVCIFIDVRVETQPPEGPVHEVLSLDLRKSARFVKREDSQTGSLRSRFSPSHFQVKPRLPSKLQVLPGVGPKDTDSLLCV